jgi:phage-related protein
LDKHSKLYSLTPSSTQVLKTTWAIHIVAVYTVKIADRVYVLHCFQKKSTKGIETPKQDMDLIRERLKAAQAHAKGA